MQWKTSIIRIRFTFFAEIMTKWKNCQNYDTKILYIHADTSFEKCLI